MNFTCPEETCKDCSPQCNPTEEKTLSGTSEEATKTYQEYLQKAMGVITPEMKEKLKENRTEADKLKVKYDNRYNWSLGTLVGAALACSYGAEKIYPGAGMFVFGGITLLAARVALLVNDQIRSLIGGYIVQIDQLLDGRSLGQADPRTMTTTTLPKPPSSNKGFGQYL